MAVKRRSKWPWSIVGLRWLSLCFRLFKGWFQSSFHFKHCPSEVSDGILGCLPGPLILPSLELLTFSLLVNLKILLLYMYFKIGRLFNFWPLASYRLGFTKLLWRQKQYKISRVIFLWFLFLWIFSPSAG